MNHFVTVHGTRIPQHRIGAAPIQFSHLTGEQLGQGKRMGCLELHSKQMAGLALQGLSPYPAGQCSAVLPYIPVSKPGPAAQLSWPSIRTDPLAGRLLNQPLSLEEQYCPSMRGTWPLTECLHTALVPGPHCLWVYLKQYRNEALFINCIPPKVSFESLRYEPGEVH